MEHYQIQCVALINKCKQEAKQLVELAATRHKVHWSQSCFISFCISVEDILSYGTKRRYSASKQLSSSGKILADLAKTFPVATATYDKCYGSKSMLSREDYAHLVTSLGTERRVLWLRVAIIESSLFTLVNEIIKNAGKYYTEHSVVCHRVYGEIFGYLLDGPCSIRFSRLKVADSAIMSPSPAEIVKRHNKVLSASVFKIQQDGQSQTGTEEAWDHVKSLYQTSAATCLFGKNNIHVQPAGFSDTLAGYLTLQLVVDNLQLKWIPNSLLKSTSNTVSSLWDHVISLEVGTDVAHIHCHRSGDSAELILIGYDGIAYPRMIFSHQPSLFQFLECLENNLLPRGCLEPPLWYIKTQTAKAKRSSWRHLASPSPISSEWGMGEGEEWWEGVDVWNQVFRLRFSGGKLEEKKSTSEPVVQGHLPPPPHLPLNLTRLPSTHGTLSVSSSTSSSTTSSARSSPAPPASSEEEHATSISSFGLMVEKPSSLARKDWEKFQLKVSKQLLARYFYSWLSYCRHMKKVHDMVAHMVDASAPMQGEDPANYRDGIVKELWAEFQAKRNEASWLDLLKTIYLKGVPEALRPQIWPWLLGLYPVSSSREETESIAARAHESYHQKLADWRKVEEVHLRILAVAERKRQERWKRETAALLAKKCQTDGVAGEGEKGGEGGETNEVGLKGEQEGISGQGEEGTAVNGEAGGDDVRGVQTSANGVGGLLTREDSCSSPTPVPSEHHSHSDLHNSYDHVAHAPILTPPSTTPLITPSQTSRSPSPEVPTLSDLSIITQSTASPFPSPHSTHSLAHSPHNDVRSPQNGVVTKTRSSSVDSGHPSDSNLGDSVGSGHGNSFNGCHGDTIDGGALSTLGDSMLEWNGDGSGMGTSQVEGGNELVSSTRTLVPEGEGRGEVEEEKPEELVLDERGQLFAEELIKIDKDIPRCDREYWFFKEPGNLEKLRNIVSTYVWTHLKDGYSQGMCDLLAPLLVVLQNEALTYACFLRLMETAIDLFPPHTGMNTRLYNLKALLQVLEPDFFQYLSERPMGDGLFYCYRWFLVAFKREFEYRDIFRLWETWWAAGRCCSAHFLEFCGLAIMTQFKPAIMDSRMDSSDILNLFTDLADLKAIDCVSTITIAQRTIRELLAALTQRE